MVATSMRRRGTRTSFREFCRIGRQVNPVQTPQTGVRVRMAKAGKGKAFFLPFLGDVQEISGVHESDGRISYTLPTITKGAVFWYEGGEAKPTKE
jgi:hypothetical protein